MGWTSASRTIPISRRAWQSSLKTGIAAVPDDAAGALVLLGDMPAVSSADLDRLVAAFRKAGGQAIVRATHERQAWQSRHPAARSSVRWRSSRATPARAIWSRPG